MPVLIEQMPFQTFVIPPFNELRNLAAHKQQFFSGMRQLVHKKRFQRFKLLPIQPGHFLNQRSFPMHNLVMRKRKNIIFRKCVHHGERQNIMISAPEIRVHAHIAQHIVHPAHVPFIVKAEPPVPHGLCNKRPCRHHPDCLSPSAMQWIPPQSSARWDIFQKQPR